MRNQRRIPFDNLESFILFDMSKITNNNFRRYVKPESYSESNHYFDQILYDIQSEIYHRSQKINNKNYKIVKN